MQVAGNLMRFLDIPAQNPSVITARAGIQTLSQGWRVSPEATPAAGIIGGWVSFIGGTTTRVRENSPLV